VSVCERKVPTFWVIHLNNIDYKYIKIIYNSKFLSQLNSVQIHFTLIAVVVIVIIVIVIIIIIIITIIISFKPTKVLHAFLISPGCFLVPFLSLFFV
jgi:hypothetical protein